MKAAEELEARRRERASEGLRQEWWWFDPANKHHAHEFSAAWEILRRTRSYQLLYIRMRAVGQTVDPHSLFGVFQSERAMTSFREMLQPFESAPAELRDMVGRWQAIIVQGWTPEKFYLEASNGATAECMLPDGKVIRIPEIYGGLNRGVPVILPRQTVSAGQTALFVELLEAVLAPGQAPEVVHLAGSTGPSEMLQTMSEFGLSVGRKIKGRFVAIEFPLNRPVQALKALVKSGLDSIEQSEDWKPGASVDLYSHGPQVVIGTLNSLEAIALFPADKPRSVIERGFRTLIRPEQIKKFLPRVRAEWIEWDFGERAKYAPDRSKEMLLKESRAAWEEGETQGRLARQSTRRPIRPSEDLDNLACADCAPFHRRSHADLLQALPPRLRNDTDINKRIATGLRLISGVDELFLPLLESPLPPSA